MNVPHSALDGQQIGLINNNVYDNGPPTIPTERIAEALGSQQNRGIFLITEANLNMMKGRIMNGVNPVGGDKVRTALQSAQQGSWNDFFSALSRVFEAFTYMAGPDVRNRQRNVLNSVRAEAALYERLGATNAMALTRAYNVDYFNYIATRTQTWLRGWITQARALIPATGRTPAQIAASITLDYYERQINAIINFNGLV